MRKLVFACPFLLMAYGAHADCSNSILNGDYGFTVHAHVLSADGSTSTGLIDGVGTITFDGMGNATQQDFIVLNAGLVGSGFRTGETATYTVNPDCTGTLTVTLGPGSTRVSGFVITRRGSVIHSVVSESTNGGSPAKLQAYVDFERMDAR